MRILILISLLLLVSCRTVKQNTDHSTIIRDSLIITNIQVVDTIKIEKKEITGGIPLDWFKAFGSYTIQDRGVKTEIRYVNDSIKVYTLVDSSLHLFIKQYLNNIQRSNHQTKTSTKNKSRSDVSVLYFIIIASSIIAIVLIIKHKLKWVSK